MNVQLRMPRAKSSRPIIWENNSLSQAQVSIPTAMALRSVLKEGEDMGKAKKKAESGWQLKSKHRQKTSKS